MATKKKKPEPAKKARKPKSPAAPPPSKPQQQQLFAPERTPAARPVEAPAMEPEAPRAPSEPTLPRDVAFPPEASFTAPFVEGSLAHHLTQPETRVDRVVERKFRQERYPWISEWTGAADAGDPCIRKLVYQRIAPEAALPDDGEMAFLFKHGQWVEKEVLAEMADAGYEVVEQQRPFHDEALKVKGKIDGKLMMHHQGKRTRPPFEIKGYAPSTWDQINSAKDMLDSHAGYLKKVPAQVTLYLVLDKEQDADAAVLYMKNKMTGKPKTIIVPRDEAYASWLMGRLRMVRDYVLRKELPPRIEFDETICGKCQFRATCLKEMPAGPNPLVLDPEKQTLLAELLQEWWSLKPGAKMWDALDKKLQAMVKGHQKIIIGDYIVTGNWIPGTRVDQKAMSEEHRKLYEKDSPSWRKLVVNVKETLPGIKE